MINLISILASMATCLLIRPPRSPHPSNLMIKQLHFIYLSSIYLLSIYLYQVKARAGQETYKNIPDAFRKILKNEGARAFWKGGPGQ